MPLQQNSVHQMPAKKLKASSAGVSRNSCPLSNRSMRRSSAKSISRDLPSAKRRSGAIVLKMPPAFGSSAPARSYAFDSNKPARCVPNTAVWIAPALEGQKIQSFDLPLDEFQLDRTCRIHKLRTARGEFRLYCTAPIHQVHAPIRVEIICRASMPLHIHLV